MFEWFQSQFPALNSGGNILLMIGVGLGTMLFVYGAFDSLRPANPAARRYRRTDIGERMSSFDAGLLHNPEVDPKGLYKALMPTKKGERSVLRRNLTNAGFIGEGAVWQFTLWRIALAILLPAVVVALMVARQMGVWMPEPVLWFIDGMPRLVLYQLLALLAGVGFFIPAIWLKHRVKMRVREIEESFPNALDLIQISVEAGMGLDAAMTRVANEMVHSAPALSQEFRIVQLEVSAGRDRELALIDMSTRTGVEEVVSFANVILQSLRFGTSISDALQIYANEMRQTRELKAQEKANKLPVKMSAVMSALMLPAMILLIVGPVVIRWMNTFG
ncbi:MAG: type II secretion system F family protein [Silicimonas sp.]|nr:type II secretion system F family protein [Silicimonas sp.]NND18065.1 type II secretion system F family protein [Silicimonas sp.]